MLEIILAFCMTMHRKLYLQGDRAGTPAQVRGSGDLLQDRLFSNARKAGDDLTFFHGQHMEYIHSFIPLALIPVKR